MVLSADDITSLLNSAREGDRQAAEQVIGAVYDGLRKVARRYMAAERSGHTLQPTCLVNDVLLHLFPQGAGAAGTADIDWQSRVHFLSVAAKQMRRVLVDYARQKRAVKREGLRLCVDDLHGLSASKQPEFEFDVLNHLLELLASRDADAAQVIELRFFGGLTDAEVVEAMKSNLAKVRRDWEFGRSWLRQRMKD